MTHTTTDGESGDVLDALFAALADDRRRRLLGILRHEAPGAVTEGELATRLATLPDDRPSVAGTGEAGPGTADPHQRVRVRLRHTHLPKLAAAGLIERDADGNVVAATGHPAYRDPGVCEALDGRVDADSGSLDALFAALADGRRRAILDVLSHQVGPIHTETLARELDARDGDAPESDVPGDAVEDALVGLRHVHLPRLSGAGLIDYDAAAKTVQYAGHPQLRVPWMHSVLAPDFRTSLTGESSVQEIATIEGRESVVSFGQSLCDRATEELFCMFTATDLLEAGCLTRIRDASRNGVDVYLGTSDPDIREYVRTHAPEVVLWEPETDWLDLPVEEDRVGRLLLADREAVMLGTLGERTGDGTRTEQSIVGEGAENSLVVLVRQLLRSRLARIDGETEGDAGATVPL